MQNEDSMTPEDISSMLDAVLGPQSPFPTPEEIALHTRRREQGISMQSFLAAERFKSKEKAVTEKLKRQFAERQGDQQ